MKQQTNKKTSLHIDLKGYYEPFMEYCRENDIKATSFFRTVIKEKLGITPVIK